jgi:hypothetical protein
MQMTTVLALIAGINLALLHGLAMYLDLYWRYAWLDIPMHVMGGAVLVLFWAALIDVRLLRHSTLQIRQVCVVAGVIMIAWEVFGVIVENGFKDKYVIDTSIDLCAGSVGVALGYLVVRAVYNTKL